MNLRFTRRALQQIDAVLGYIAEQSPQGAANVEARLTAVLSLLQQHPNTGSKTTAPNVRRLLLTPYPYLIDYHVEDRKIVILRFRHSARRPVMR